MKVKASAPAKVILLGEHAVVYGIPAIAIPIPSLRAFATVDKAYDRFSIVADDLKNDNVSLSVDINDVNNPLTQIALLIFDYYQIDQPNLKISIRSDIPIASGLGSGAAVSTAIGRAIASALEVELSDSILNEMVFEVEKYHHGTPSGIDNTVIVYENPIYYVKDEPIQHLEIGKPFHIIVADTGQTALTHEAVGDVRRLYEGQPEQVKSIFERIENIVIQAKNSIKQGDFIQLGQLMSENHHYLQELTVSSPRLDLLVNIAMESGAFGAKLSGGGRGGNMIALVNESDVKSVTKALHNGGAKRVFSSVIH